MEIISKQKFFRGDMVYIKPITNKSRSHFTSDCNAIILYSYRDCFDKTTEIPEYELLLLDRENKPYRNSAWYPETDLNIVLIANHRDRNYGEQIIQTYLDNL